MNKTYILPAIKETTRDYEAIEKAIRDHFKRELYIPILRELGYGQSRLLNSKDVPSLHQALLSGKITFNRGVFSGKFNSRISQELRSLGARFDRLTSTYRLSQKDMPLDLRNTISVSDDRFRQRIEKIDKKLGAVLTEEVMHKGISQKLGIDHMFDRALWRVDKEFHKNVRNITVAPNLTPEQRKKIAAQWGENMDIWIEDFSKKEITELRQKVMDAVFAGDRYGSMVKTIQDSYGVTERKAKFLAKQETSLLMASFKQTRYQSAGVDYYKWQCVSGSPKHPVRPYHKKNDGKVYKFSDPPTVDEHGAKKNPGQDYNCRCTPRPLVNYHGPTGVKLK